MRETLNPKLFLPRIKIESSLKIKRHFEYTHTEVSSKVTKKNLSLCCFYEASFESFSFLSFSLLGDLKTKRWFGKKTLHYFWNNSHN